MVLCAMYLQSTRETNDDRQREFEEKLQQHQAKVAVEEQRMQTAEAAFRQREEELQQLSVREQHKVQELNDLQRRYELAEASAEASSMHAEDVPPK